MKFGGNLVADPEKIQRAADALYPPAARGARSSSWFFVAPGE